MLLGVAHVGSQGLFTYPTIAPTHTQINGWSGPKYIPLSTDSELEGINFLRLGKYTYAKPLHAFQHIHDQAGAWESVGPL